MAGSNATSGSESAGCGIERVAEDLLRRGIEQHETDLADHGVGLAHRTDRDRCRSFGRVAVDAAGDRGERDGRSAEVVGDRERVDVAARQQSAASRSRPA